jgi:hypothetical chaperone protein
LIDKNLGFNVYEEIERVKKGLTVSQSANFSFHHHGIAIDEEVTRKCFESLIMDDLGRIESTIHKSLQKAQITKEEIDAVITTGGSSLIPVIRTMLAKMFGIDKLKSKDTFTSVASGLALKAQTIFE